MTESMFWLVLGVLLCGLGAVGLLTAGWLRLKGRTCRAPLLNGALGVTVGLVLTLIVR